ncbi:hypothetical protein AB0L63_06745 [Nocardia sp. NPDC051990]|uniref:hypothetical protein n=1 Tax=Nocardia sp. NPDC051990 TaxID=3155285 RepID=UPI0034385862
MQTRTLSYHLTPARTAPQLSRAAPEAVARCVIARRSGRFTLIAIADDDRAWDEHVLFVAYGTQAQRPHAHNWLARPLRPDRTLPSDAPSCG